MTYANAPSAIRGAVTGLLVLAVFSTAWALAGATVLHGWGAPAPAVLAVVLGIVLLGRAGARGRHGGRPPLALVRARHSRRIP